MEGSSNLHVNPSEDEADNDKIVVDVTAAELVNIGQIAGRFVVLHADDVGGSRRGCGKIEVTGDGTTSVNADLTPYEGFVAETYYSYFTKTVDAVGEVAEVTHTVTVETTVGDANDITFTIVGDELPEDFKIELFGKDSGCTGTALFETTVAEATLNEAATTITADTGTVTFADLKDYSIGFTLGDDAIVCDALVIKEGIAGHIMFYRTAYGVGYVGHATGLPTTTKVIEDGAGWHVHSGDTCAATGHLIIGEGDEASDPWTAKYKTIAGFADNGDSTKGRTLFSGEIDGVTMADISGKTMVVHRTKTKLK